jgi:hypothetical protein
VSEQARRSRGRNFAVKAASVARTNARPVRAVDALRYNTRLRRYDVSQMMSPSSTSTSNATNLNAYLAPLQRTGHAEP